MSDAPLNTHGYRMKVGRHAGERITRVPVGYLKWMVNQGHSESANAAAELARRGTITPGLDVSGHAIDKASLRCLRQWKETRKDGEGLHAWLVRVATEAIEKEGGPKERISYMGIGFRFEVGTSWPVLKTVVRGSR